MMIKKNTRSRELSLPKKRKNLSLYLRKRAAMASNAAEVPASYSKNLCACIGCHLVKTKDQVREEAVERAV